MAEKEYLRISLTSQHVAKPAIRASAGSGQGGIKPVQVFGPQLSKWQNLDWV